MHRVSDHTGNSFLQGLGRMYLGRYKRGSHGIKGKHVGTRRDTVKYTSYFTGLVLDIVDTIESCFSMPAKV